MGKTAASLSGVFGGSQIDEALYEELESALLLADTGFAATQFLTDSLRKKAKSAGVTNPVALKNLLIAELGRPVAAAAKTAGHRPAHAHRHHGGRRQRARARPLPLANSPTIWRKKGPAFCWPLPTPSAQPPANNSASGQTATP